MVFLRFYCFFFLVTPSKAEAFALLLCLLEKFRWRRLLVPEIDKEFQGSQSSQELKDSQEMGSMLFLLVFCSFFLQSSNDKFSVS